MRVPRLLSEDLLAPALRGPGPSLENDDDDSTSAGSEEGVGGGGGDSAVSSTESTTTVVTGFLDITTSAFFADWG